jgi:hypothetical protein
LKKGNNDKTPSKSTSGKGRGAAQKNKKTDDDEQKDTGDDNTENEGASPSKKAKGKPGRKAGQKPKNTNQEIENETGNYLN